MLARRQRTETRDSWTVLQDTPREKRLARKATRCTLPFTRLIRNRNLHRNRKHVSGFREMRGKGSVYWAPDVFLGSRKVLKLEKSGSCTTLCVHQMPLNCTVSFFIPTFFSISTSSFSCSLIPSASFYIHPFNKYLSISMLPVKFTCSWPPGMLSYCIAFTPEHHPGSVNPTFPFTHHVYTRPPQVASPTP